MITVTRCLEGRLRDAYPAARHDVELRVDGVPRSQWVDVLATQAELAFRTDPACRKVVFGVPAGDLDAVGVAEAAGFRYVVDVDVLDRTDRTGRAAEPLVELSLLVREPDFVTRVDMDLDRVPQS